MTIEIESGVRVELSFLSSGVEVAHFSGSAEDVKYALEKWMEEQEG